MSNFLTSVPAKHRNAIGTGLFVAVVAIMGFGAHLYATAPSSFVESLAGTGIDSDVIGTAAWTDAGNITADDGDYAFTDTLSSGFGVLSDTPMIPDGVGYGATFSPDGRYLAVPQDIEDGGLSLIDMTTLELVEGLVQPAGHIEYAEFSPDGDHLALGGDSLTIIDTSAEDPGDWTVSYATTTDAQVQALGFSPDSGTLAVGYDTTTPVRVAILDVDSETFIDDEGSPFDYDIADHVYDFAFSPDGQYLAIGVQNFDEGNTYRIIDTDTWLMESVPVAGESLSGSAVAFSPDGTKLVIGHQPFEDALTVIDISDPSPAGWEIERIFTPDLTPEDDEDGDVRTVWSLAFSPDGDMLAIAYLDSPYFGIIDTSSSDADDWEGIDTSGSIGALDGGKGGNTGQGVAFSPDGSYIAVAHYGGSGLSIIGTEEVAMTHYLLATGFDLTVPENATITGLEVAVNRAIAEPTDHITDAHVRLLVGEDYAGTDMADEDTEWAGNPEVAETKVYGNDSDDWGAGLTPDDVNVSSLSVAIAANVAIGSAGVDAITMTVYYSTPEEPGTTRSSSSRSGQKRPSAAPSDTSSGSAIDALKAKLADLLAQLQGRTDSGAGSETSAAAPSSIRDLEMGMEGADVKALQELLIAADTGPYAPELARIGATSYFGTYTRDALAEYQAKFSIAPAVGYFGALSRAQMKAAGLSGLWW